MLDEVDRGKNDYMTIQVQDYLKRKRLGYEVRSDGPTEYLQVIIKESTGTQNGGVERIMREIEDALIEYVRDRPEHKSLGRLLYELEASKEWGEMRNRSIGPVFQRNYKDPASKVYRHTDILELPFDSDGNAHGRFLLGEGGSLIADMRRKYHCNIDIFGVFEKEEWFCDPYVIITSSERLEVIEAKKFIIFKIREHQGKCARKCTLRWQS